MIKRQIFLCVVVVGLALSLSACTNPYDPVQRTIGGGLIGAGSGAPAVSSGRRTRCGARRGRRWSGGRGGWSCHYTSAGSLPLLILHACVELRRIYDRS